MNKILVPGQCVHLIYTQLEYTSSGCGWSTAPGEEVGSRYEREVQRKRTPTDGGAVGHRREPRTTQKRLRQVRQAG